MLRFTIVVGSVLSFVPSCPCYGPDFYCEDSGGDGGDDAGAGVCGDGIVDSGEQCDLGPQNADDGACTSACALAACGDGLVQRGEEKCDDGGTISGDGCSDTCTDEGCTWDVAQHTFPNFVWTGQAVLGEIAFDGNCDLIVGGGEEKGNLYRVDKDDGSVSIVAQVPPSVMITGITYRASDKRVYFAAGVPEALYALDDQDQVHALMPIDDPIWSLTVAPEGFGDFGGQLIAVVSDLPELRGLQAIDVETGVITTFAQSDTGFSVAAFGNDGTLYVADWGGDRILTVTADGVFTPFYTGIHKPNGLAIAPDGSRMFVAHLSDTARIDEISIPGATLTPRVAIEQGFVGTPIGIVVDGANHVLYEVPHTDYNHALIDMFEAP